MRHARRTKLKVEDVDLALRVRNIEVLCFMVSLFGWPKLCVLTPGSSLSGASHRPTLCPTGKRRRRRGLYISWMTRRSTSTGCFKHSCPRSLEMSATRV
jgi:hypothetical protein